MPDPLPESALLSGHGLRVRIGEIPVVNHLDLAVYPGQCWCILGPNGVGKTTLLHTLCGLHSPVSGSLKLEAKPLNHYSRRQIAQRIGVLFQEHDDPFPATVLETVLQGRHPHLHAWQWETEKDWDVAKKSLDEVGLGAMESRNVQTLSGGERQRVSIASLLAQDPALLLLDEPTNHLDLHHCLSILQQLVKRCRKQNKAICMVLHDVNLAARFADHVLLLLGNGETRYGPTEEILQTDTLERLYGHTLIRVEGPSASAWLPE